LCGVKAWGSGRYQSKGQQNEADFGKAHGLGRFFTKHKSCMEFYFKIISCDTQWICVNMGFLNYHQSNVHMYLARTPPPPVLSLKMREPSKSSPELYDPSSKRQIWVLKSTSKSMDICMPCMCNQGPNYHDQFFWGTLYNRVYRKVRTTRHQ
jgi:hypothetical protein